jgi:hypothetical protein
MESNTRSKVAIVLGLVILVADMLWLYGSFAHYGGGVVRGAPYRNLSSNPGAAAYGYNSTGTTLRGAGYSGYIDLVYGLVILVADVAWLYLDFIIAKPKTQAKKR